MDNDKVLQSILGQEKRVSAVERALTSLEASVSQTEVGVRKIEQELHRPKSALEKFKELAGVISLVLGLIISGFTIYESAYKKPSAIRLSVNINVSPEQHGHQPAGLGEADPAVNAARAGSVEVVDVQRHQRRDRPGRLHDDRGHARRGQALAAAFGAIHPLHLAHLRGAIRS